MKKYILLILIFSIILSLIVAATNMGASATPDSKVIALTFDDGPNTNACVQVLDVLEKYNVPATFMIIGQNMNDKTTTIMQRMVFQNCQIGYHGYNHANMASWTLEQINDDFNKTSDKIFEQCGVRPEVVRWPFLAEPGVVSYNDDFPYAAMGGFCPNDWDMNTSKETRIEKFVADAKDGEILLMHCNENNSITAEALDTIIPTLRDKGYSFVTIDDLFATQNCEMKYGKQWANVPYSSIPLVTTARTTADPNNTTTKTTTVPTTLSPDGKDYGNITYRTWYANNCTAACDKTGGTVTSDATKRPMIQPNYSTTGLKNLAARSTDGNVYIDVSGTFNGSKVFVKYGCGQVEIGNDWEYVLQSGKSVTLKIPIDKVTDESVSFNILDYTYGGFSDANITISFPYIISGTTAPSQTASITSPSTTASTTTPVVPTTSSTTLPIVPTTSSTTAPVTPITSSTTATTTASTSAVETYKCGDINEDGKINGKDALALKLHNASRPTEVFNEEAADTNGDGKINGKDALTLKKYNSGRIRYLPYFE